MDFVLHVEVTIREGHLVEWPVHYISIVGYEPTMRVPGHQQVYLVFLHQFSVLPAFLQKQPQITVRVCSAVFHEVFQFTVFFLREHQGEPVLRSLNVQELERWHEFASQSCSIANLVKVFEATTHSFQELVVVAHRPSGIFFIKVNCWVHLLILQIFCLKDGFDWFQLVVFCELWVGIRLGEGFNQRSICKRRNHILLHRCEHWLPGAFHKADLLDVLNWDFGKLNLDRGLVLQLCHLCFREILHQTHLGIADRLEVFLKVLQVMLDHLEHGLESSDFDTDHAYVIKAILQPHIELTCRFAAFNASWMNIVTSPSELFVANRAA